MTMYYKAETNGGTWEWDPATTKIIEDFRAKILAVPSSSSLYRTGKGGLTDALDEFLKACPPAYAETDKDADSKRAAFFKKELQKMSQEISRAHNTAFLVGDSLDFGWPILLNDSPWIANEGITGKVYRDDHEVYKQFVTTMNQNIDVKFNVGVKTDPKTDAKTDTKTDAKSADATKDATTPDAAKTEGNNTTVTKNDTKKSGITEDNTASMPGISDAGNAIYNYGNNLIGDTVGHGGMISGLFNGASSLVSGIAGGASKLFNGWAGGTGKSGSAALWGAGTAVGTMFLLPAIANLIPGASSIPGFQTIASIASLVLGPIVGLMTYKYMGGAKNEVAASGPSKLATETTPEPTNDNALQNKSVNREIPKPKDPAVVLSAPTLEATR